MKCSENTDVFSIPWDDEPQTAAVIDKLRMGIELETRDYTRPIFRWTKARSKAFDSERAFQFAKYLMLISTIGDSSRKILPNQAIQPKYVFNILITMAQRRGNAADALRAYEEISRNGFEPDVFTLTALIDVVGRSDDSSGGLAMALEIYNKMLTSGKTKPNVVTYVTLLRLLGQYALATASSSAFGAEQIAQYVLGLLADANLVQKDPENSSATAQVDHSIYNAALAVCVRLTDIETLTTILKDMREKNVGLNQPALRILAKFLYACRKIGKYSENAISSIIGCSDMSEEQLGEVQLLLSTRESSQSTSTSKFTNQALDDSRPSKPVYVPCLGPGAAESLRQSVITHDLDKLLERLTSPSYGVSLSEGDFATLIHQCRKRKWGGQIRQVLEFLHILSSSGFPEKGVAAQYHLCPTIIVYEATLDAYFSMGHDQAANELYAQITAESSPSALRHQASSSEFMLGLIKGYLHCGNSGYAVEAYRQMRGRGGLPSRAIVSGLMHGLGRDVQNAVEILKDVCSLSSTNIDNNNIINVSLPPDMNTSPEESDGCEAASLFTFSTGPVVDSSDTATVATAAVVAAIKAPLESGGAEDITEMPPFTRQSLQRFVCILLESCAVLENNTGLEHILDLAGFTSTTSGTESSKSLGSILAELVEGHNCDFVVACLMVAVCDRSPLEAHDFVQKYQASSVLPPFPFLHTLVEECFAPVEQFLQKPKFSGLPFAGFLRFGTLKCLERKRKFVRRALSQMNPTLHSRGDDVRTPNCSEAASPNSSSSTASDGVERIAAIHNFFFPATATAVAATPGDGSERPSRFAPDDPLLVLLVLLSCGVSSDYVDSSCSVRGARRQHGDIVRWCSPAAGILLLHHLYVRQQYVRSKTEKETFRGDIMTAVREIERVLYRGGGGSGTSMTTVDALDLSSACGRVVQACLASVSVLELPTRQSAKVLSALFDCLAVTLAEASVEIDSALILTAASTYTPSLELLKEMNKCFRLTDAPEGCRVAGAVVLALLRRGREKPIKAIQFIRQHNLDAAEEEAYSLQLEELIVAAFLREDDASVWSACMSYLAVEEKTASSLSLQNEKCVRIINQMVAIYEETGNISIRDTAVRLICKFDLGDTVAFRHLLSSTLSAIVDNDDDHVDETWYDDCLRLPSSGHDVVWVDCEEDVDLAAALLGLGISIVDAASDDSDNDDTNDIVDGDGLCGDVEGGARLVGIDVEWRPFSTGGAPTKCSLLQIASLTHSFLFDLIGLSLDQAPTAAAKVRRFFRALLRDQTIRKIGYGFSGDLKRLRDSYPTVFDMESSDTVNLLDVSSLRPGKSLSKTCLELLGRPLDKRMQRSDWQRRPLTAEQISYAALDAFVLVEIGKLLSTPTAINATERVTLHS